MRRSSMIKKMRTEKKEFPLNSSPSFEEREGPSKNAQQAIEYPLTMSKNDPSPSQSTTSSKADMATVKTVANPLENVVVLNHLFKLCPKELLANCRIVSKLWFQESLGIWRTRMPITFILEKEQLFLTNQSRDDEARQPLRIQLQMFLAYCDDPKNQCYTKPFRSLKMIECKLSLNPKQFQMLWNMVGSQLTTLYLSECDLFDVEEFRKLLFGTCPNLKTMILKYCNFKETQTRSYDRVVELEYREPLYGKHKHLKSFQFIETRFEPLPISWLELFSHLQSLTHFKVETQSVKSREFSRITDAIRILRKRDPKALPFQCVDIDVPISLPPRSKRNVEVLQELRLPIKSLFFEFKVYEEMDEDSMKAALECQAKTVRRIDIQLCTARAPTGVLCRPFLFGVQMDHLKILVIDEQLCESVDFLKFTPNLENLAIPVSLYTFAYGQNDIIKKTKIISSSRKGKLDVRMLRLVRFRLDYCSVTDADLASLVEWMPHVQRLKMALTDKQFGRVCGSWGNLTELTVLGDELTDGGVTGRKHLKEGWLRAAKKQPVAKKLSRPNITDLQKLKQFGFTSPHLTCDSVLYGFLKLPHLRKISFCLPNVRFDEEQDLGWGDEAMDGLEKRHVELEDDFDDHVDFKYNKHDYGNDF